MLNDNEDTIFSEGYEIIFDEAETPEQIAARTAQELEDNDTTPDDTANNSVKPNEQFFEETEENDDDIDNSTPDDDTSSQVFRVLAKGLSGDGVITSSTEEIEAVNDVNGLFTLVSNTIKKQNEAYKESLPPLVKYLTDNWEEGVDIEQLLPKKIEAIKYENIDTSVLDEETSITLLNNYLTLKGHSPEEIAETIADTKKLGKVVERASKVLPILKDYAVREEQEFIQQQKAIKKANEDAQKVYSTSFNTFINTATDFGGVVLTPEAKKKAVEVMAVPIKDGDQITTAFAKARNANPSEFDARIALLYTLSNGFTDFSAFATKGKKQVIKEIKDSVHKIEGGKSGSPAQKDDITSIIKSLKLPY